MINSYVKSSNIPFDINVLTGTAVAGLVIKMFFGQNLSIDGASGPAMATIWGYGVLALSLMGLLVVSLALGSKIDMQNTVINFIKSGLKNSLPVFLLILIVSWLIAMNVRFFTRINQCKVADEYTTLSTASSAMIALQIVLLLKYLRDVSVSDRNQLTGKSFLSKAYAFISSQIGVFLYLLAAVNLVLAGAMQVVLQFFSTDG